MKINMIRLPVRDLVVGYSEDDKTSRVVAWGGKLDVRPEYQREYVYDDKQRDAVITTVLNGFPLNIMYFVDRQDGTYEVLDGQQRIISICRYYSNSAISVKLPTATGGFNTVNYPNLFDKQKRDFLDYELQVYICEGTDDEKLNWFQIINIAGEEQNGLYENAEKIIYCLSGFISAIGTVMMAKVSHMQEKGETEKIARNIDRSMNLVICMVSAMAFGVAAVADRFAPLFFGEEFRYSGVLMVPLAFTLIMIGFANVIRTQVVLPQKRDHIFVKSVCAGAVVNLIVNGSLIPFMGSMGAVIGTLMAEMTVPVVQFIILRKELPYKRFIGYVGIYAVMGGIMLVCVRLIGQVFPAENWLNLGIMTVTGVIVYGAMCLICWKASGKGIPLRSK